MEIVKSSELLQLADSINIEILEGAYARLGADWNMENACAPYSRLYYVEAGRGTLTFPQEQVLLEPGYVYLIPQDTVYGYACTGFLKKLYFHINVPLPNGFDLFYKEKGCRRLPMEQEVLAEMRRLFFAGNLESALALKGRLYADAGRFIAQMGLSPRAEARYSSLVAAAVSQVAQSVTAGVGLGSLAKALAVSESTLSKHFKRETGMSVGAYTDRMLLEKACRLLVKTEAPIGEISEILQFCDQFYFARYFKQHLGESPSGYRKRLRQSM